MSPSIYPARYLIANSEQTKQLNVVIQIDGVSDVLSIVPVYEKLRYGDPRLSYGLLGLVYGGLVLKDGVRSLLMIDQGLTIGQKIEPEQGRGGIATLTLPFLDKDEYMTKLISPGVLLDEPLGNKLVTVWVGFANTAFPDDYYTAFRGFITDTTSFPGMVTLQLSDANIKRRQQIFYGGKSTLTGSITSGSTTIPINVTSGFFAQILRPGGGYDPSVTTYLKIEDEWMSYPGGSIGPSSITSVSRGQRGTSAASHAINLEVANGVQLQGNTIDLMLKIMLSGWNGPWKSGVSSVCMGTTQDPLDPRTNVIKFLNDVVVTYGLTVGDYITIVGGPNNGTTVTITAIEDQATDSNRLVIVSSNLALDNPSVGTLSFRSQYDTLPIACGLKNTPQEVDVATFQELKRLFFSAGQYTAQLFITTPTAGKNLIESQLCLPYGLYSITRYGRISVALTRPPIADQKFTFIDHGTICDPQAITNKRAVNNRRFFNVVTYQYDKSDAGEYAAQLTLLDNDSLALTAWKSVLPITADALKTNLGGAIAAQTRGRFLLNRFKRAAYEIDLSVFWGTGSTIEISDVVALVDNGTLKVTNFETGKRDLGTALYEVIDRQLDIKNGRVKLKLLSSLGYKVTDRYATYAPSSLVTAGSTTTTILIQDSFGPEYPGNEKKKWARLTGMQIRVHSYDYTVDQTTTLQGFDPANPYRMLVSPPLSSPPSAGHIVDLAPYGTGTNPAFQAMAKTLYDFFSPTLTVVSGISNTSFTVSGGDAAKMTVGKTVIVHSADYSTLSPEVKVLSIVGTTVTVASSLGFTPSAGQEIDGVGFLDGGGFYRWL